MALLKTNYDYTPQKGQNKTSVVTYVQIVTCSNVAMATQSTDVVGTQQEVGPLFLHTGKVVLSKADVAVFYI